MNSSNSIESLDRATESERGTRKAWEIKIQQLKLCKAEFQLRLLALTERHAKIAPESENPRIFQPKTMTLEDELLQAADNQTTLNAAIPNLTLQLANLQTQISSLTELNSIRNEV
jgi:predicted  nucleic acid-binding Zn-ribbon protein